MQGPIDNPKPRGRRTAYAFFREAFKAEYMETHEESEMSFTEFALACNTSWNALPEEDKRIYQEKAVRDKARYAHQMRAYQMAASMAARMAASMAAINQRPTRARGLKRRAMMDVPNPPKAPKDAFFFFCAAERDAVQAQHPELGYGAVSSELGQRWRKATEETMQKYELMAVEDEARYKREDAVYGLRLEAAFIADEEDADNEDD